MTRPLFYIDDEIEILEVAKLYFKQSPFRLKTFSSADEALNDPELLDSPIIMTDAKMPTMTGEVFIEKVCAKGFKGRFILISGDFTDSKVKLGASRVRHLLKPIDYDALIDLLREELKK